MEAEALLAFRLVTEDVGCTQALTVYLGQYKLGKWLTHTKYEERSIGIGVTLLGQALKPLIEEAMLAECTPFDGSEYDWEHGDPYDW